MINAAPMPSVVVPTPPAAAGSLLWLTVCSESDGFHRGDVVCVDLERRAVAGDRVLAELPDGELLLARLEQVPAGATPCGVATYSFRPA